MHDSFDPMKFIREAVGAVCRGVALRPSMQVTPDNVEPSSAVVTFTTANRIIASPTTIRVLLTDEMARMHMHYNPVEGDVTIEGIKVIKDLDAPLGHFAVAYVEPFRKP